MTLKNISIALSAAVVLLMAYYAITMAVAANNKMNETAAQNEAAQAEFRSEFGIEG